MIEKEAQPGSPASLSTEPQVTLRVAEERNDRGERPDRCHLRFCRQRALGVRESPRGETTI
jgi:hypothetical protein